MVWHFGVRLNRRPELRAASCAAQAVARPTSVTGPSCPARPRPPRSDVGHANIDCWIVQHSRPSRLAHLRLAWTVRDGPSEVRSISHSIGISSRRGQPVRLTRRLHSRPPLGHEQPLATGGFGVVCHLPSDTSPDKRCGTRSPSTSDTTSRRPTGKRLGGSTNPCQVGEPPGTITLGLVLRASPYGFGRRSSRVASSLNPKLTLRPGRRGSVSCVTDFRQRSADLFRMHPSDGWTTSAGHSRLSPAPASVP